MNLQFLPFDQGANFFWESVGPYFTESKRFAWSKDKWKEVLLLGDRLLIFCEDDPYFYELKTFRDFLSDLIKVNPEQRFYMAKSLLGKVEIWLKAIFQIIYPERREEMKDERVGLYYMISYLGLLTEKESQTGVTHDPIHRLIYMARVIRNRILHHPAGIPPEWEGLLIPATLAILLAPLFVHQQRIYHQLRFLIVREFSYDKIKCILQSFPQSEEKRALMDTYLFNKELQQLDLDSTFGKYILLTGKREIGKSSLCKKWMSEYKNAIEIRGSKAKEVLNVAPWLPEVIFHDCRNTEHVFDLALSIIGQANTLLVQPLPLSFLELDLSIESWKEVIYFTLERVVKERGELFLLLDHIEKFDLNIDKLEILPEFLPMGVTALLFTQSFSLTEKWLLQNRSVYHWNLDRLVQDHVANKTITPYEHKWKIYEEKSIFCDAQLFLHFFVPTDPVPVDVLQAYLTWCGWEIDRPTLIGLLEEWDESIGRIVQEQVYDRPSQIREHLEDTEYACEKLLSWLEQLDRQLEKQEADHLIIQFLMYWTEERKERDPRGRKIVLRWIEQKVQAGAYTWIYELIQKGWRSLGRFTGVNKVGLQLVIQSGYVPAMYELGIQLLSQGDMECWQEGEYWIRKAAEAYYLPAIKSLGALYLEGMRVKKNVTEGESWLRQAIELNDIEAKCLLGIYLIQNGRTKEGENWLAQAVQLGHIQAMYELGQILIDGIFLKQDMNKGLKWIRKAKMESTLNGLEWGETWGCLERLVQLGKRFIDGKGILNDPPLGEKMLRKAVESGCLIAKAELGKRLIIGAGLSSNPNQGITLLAQALHQENPLAMVYWGELLLSGSGVIQDRETGRKWLEKAASYNETLAMRILGKQYMIGNHLPLHLEKAKKWLEQAASLDDSEAMFEVGKYFLSRDEMKEGFAWVEMAAERGSRAAAFELGIRYLKGKGLAKDSGKAKKWLIHASEQNDPQAIDLLVLRLLDGKGLEKDEREAQKWLQRAIELNLKNLIRTIGLYYIRGKEVKRDLAKGKSLLKQAAILGDKQASLELGNRLIDGIDFSPSSEEGKKWLIHAAKLGSSQAMLNLAERYLHGKGFLQDRQEGLMWLEKAAHHGEFKAMTQLVKYYLFTENRGRNKEKWNSTGEYWLRKAMKVKHFEVDHLFSKETQVAETIQMKENDPLLQAAALGDQLAIMELGKRYLSLNGLSIRRDNGKIGINRLCN
ncbi:tetratricopeptide repeat protein [Thermoflavimicrobium daqui]|uniref:Sel1 repeat family protein n=1 Tax=Thermoflavimicrobium daqui TaxID=2137476 RepID=A0A364K173_9BACL|nr:tetratricopeptide repeat protein [Thermoflavimicrobium daqui]RAL21448.1 hypothetical protein DL897_15950 [Thermoflavimicrobium daqui]